MCGNEHIFNEVNFTKLCNFVIIKPGLHSYVSSNNIICSFVHLMPKFLLPGCLRQTPQAALHAEEAAV